jgi:hypothetical protein
MFDSWSEGSIVCRSGLKGSVVVAHEGSESKGACDNMCKRL